MIPRERERERGRGDTQGREYQRCAGRRDDGSATVLVLALVAVAGVLLLSLGLLAGSQAGRAAAQTAADLGALAAADAVASGRADPCAVAAIVAQRNNAQLSSCVIDSLGVVRVGAANPTRFAGRNVGTAKATARAGPAWVRELQ